jgi:hypothetical protein
MTLREGGYSHLKEEVLDRTMWRARFGRGFGPVVRQTTKLINSVSSVLLNLAEGNGQYEVLNTGRDFWHCVNNGHLVEPVDSAVKLF